MSTPGAPRGGEDETVHLGGDGGRAAGGPGRGPEDRDRQDGRTGGTGGGTARAQGPGEDTVRLDGAGPPPPAGSGTVRLGKGPGALPGATARPEDGTVRQEEAAAAGGAEGALPPEGARGGTARAQGPGGDTVRLDGAAPPPPAGSGTVRLRRPSGAAPAEPGTVRLTGGAAPPADAGSAPPGSAAGSGAPAHGAAPEAEPEGYSATALGSHWFEGPSADGTGTTRRDPRPPGPSPEPGATVPAPGPPAPGGAEPDRVEGEVLRFGPGVTAVMDGRGPATAAAVWHGPTPGPAPVPVRGRALRRYALAGGVLLAVLAFLAWQRLPTVAVRSVSVQAPEAGPGCGETADVVAVVRTNGRPGTLAYRWVRSDGSSSGRLEERVERGRDEVRLHLLWTFRGRGTLPARAELRIESPGLHTAAAGFVYRCP
ncbi:hypothetical protein [Streptomyces sp. C10-9-1]|uniref:hypothetical protein n=1 Tax=Streptomyces sp. C10-9-1 TaxID=1859285 RepID=UPI003F4A0FE9